MEDECGFMNLLTKILIPVCLLAIQAPASMRIEAGRTTVHSTKNPTPGLWSREKETRHREVTE
jgi:hypothetical protein